MKSDSKLAKKIEGGEFIVTAEYSPKASVDASAVKQAGQALGQVMAVNVADNQHGVMTSCLAVSSILNSNGVEPVYQLITRDRNRIALQSDLLGAASLGIKNVLCLSGYHQTLTDSPESANVYDIDSIQLLACVKQMSDKGVLLDGKKIEGDFGMFAGATANPYLVPMELNVIRLAKKVQAGAEFIQTQPVFDVEGLKTWVSAAQADGLTDKTAILVSVMPLASAEEAESLCQTYTEFIIPEAVIERLKGAADPKKEGIAICVEIAKKIKDVKGIRGIHIISNGDESVVSEIIAGVGL